jgi:hypothetical protein
MRRIIIVALLLLCAGCAGAGEGRPQWVKNADFLTDETRTFFTRDTNTWMNTLK